MVKAQKRIDETVSIRRVSLEGDLRSPSDSAAPQRPSGRVALSEHIVAPAASIGGGDILGPPTVSPPVTMSYSGGGLGAGSQVKLIFWGDAWNQAPTSPSANKLVSDVQSILSGPWRAGLRQYGIGRLPLAGATIVPQPPPAPSYNTASALQGDIDALMQKLFDGGFLPRGTIDIFIVFLPPGTSGPPNVVGDHWVTIDVNAPTGTGTTWVGCVFYGTESAITAAFSHELAEAVTDPDGAGWQINPRNSGAGGSWNEIGDICLNLTGVLSGVTVQGYWSAKDNACLIPTAPPLRQTLALAGIRLNGLGLRSIRGPIASLNSFVDQLFGATL
jgi:hypothetical protein